MTAPDEPLDPTTSDVPWWRRGVVYQVYPRSFADADGDGTGDVAGITSRIPYLQWLGVDAIWISPWYRSPLRDGGYDVADYRQIDPRFGTNADAEALFDAAHAHGLKVIVDLVPNHTSSDHAWFQAALAAGPGSPERDRYLFRDSNAGPPNNWQAVFGGSAWHQVPDGQWYLHLFDPSQPDLNWDNPEVRDEFDSIFRFWLDRGVDGFRIDVAHGLVKDPTMPDIVERAELLSSSRSLGHPHWDRDGVHEIIRRWRAVLDEHQARTGRDVMMVAEAWVSPKRLPLYLRPDEYHQSFNFDFLETRWELQAARTAIERAVTAAADVGSTPTWTLSNHDVMRHATRYGLPDGAAWREWPLSADHATLAAELDTERGLRRARAATLLLLALPGSTYLYQGEELGLPEVWDLPPDVLDDPAWNNSGHTTKGRDGCRVPIPWTPEPPSYGFGTGAGWLPQPAIYGQLSVAEQKHDPCSTLQLYRTALGVRRTHLVGDESLEWLELDDALLAFRRGSGIVCVVNYGDAPAPLSAGQLLLASQPDVVDTLPSETAAWLVPHG